LKKRNRYRVRDRRREREREKKEKEETKRQLLDNIYVDVKLELPRERKREELQHRLIGIDNTVKVVAKLRNGVIMIGQSAPEQEDMPTQR